MLVQIVCTLAVLIGLASTAHSAVTFTATQSGSDVIVTGSGTLNLDAWGVSAGGFNTDNLIPDMAGVIMGTAGPEIGTGYGSPTNYSAPANFGSGSAIDATSGSGDSFGITETSVLFVPTGYSSDGPLSGTMTFAGQSLASIGMTPGTYVWSWGSGGTADSITLNVVPEPTAALLVGLGVFATGLRRR